MSREERVKAAVSGGYHPGGMTLVAIELAALNDLLGPVLAEKFFAAVNEPRKCLADYTLGDSVWVKGEIVDIDPQDGTVKLDLNSDFANAGKAWLRESAEARQ